MVRHRPDHQLFPQANAPTTSSTQAIHAQRENALIWALFLSNWLTSLLGLAAAGPLARLMVIRTDLLVPVMLALAVLAALAYRANGLDLVLAAAFGIVGYYLTKHDWPRVPLVIAFVLGAVLEDNPC